MRSVIVEAPPGSCVTSPMCNMLKRPCSLSPITPVAPTQDDLKRIAAHHAVDLIQSGMVVGLGTGSTAAHALDRIGDLLRRGVLSDIVGIPTSKKTEAHAPAVGIPLSDLSNVCIRVMGAPQLGTALRFLKALKTCRLGSVFEETQDEEMPASSQISLFLGEDEVTVQLNFGTWPDHVVRWLCDSSAEVSRSSFNNAVESREHKIRKAVKKYLQFFVRQARACQTKKKRLEHSNALVNLRFLGKDDLREKIGTSDGIKKIAIGDKGDMMVQ